MTHSVLATAVIGLACGGAMIARAVAQTPEPAVPTTAPAEPPPKTWIDPDTGHRVWRLSDEPNSGPLYFNFNAYTPDQRDMVYSAPDGIHLLNLATKSEKLVVPKPVRPIQVGRKTRTLFYTKADDNGALWAADLDTGIARKLADMPRRGRIQAINSDETLAAGTYIEGDGKDYGEDAVKPAGLGGPMVQPVNKAKMMQDRLDAKLPLVLFLIDLKSGASRPLQHSTDWVNHLLFSPTDPALLMYCHEGPWQQVDRIWTIHTDGSQNQLVHERTMAGEIAGHEFWGVDGQTIWYDLQRPKAEDFFLASFKPATGERRWYHLTRDEWSIHFNVTADESLICGDGGDEGQVAKSKNGKWIELFRPELIKTNGDNKPTFIQPGVLRSERLVNMSKHNYKSEPNVRFSPDATMVIFQSTAFGPSYLFGVEVAKAVPGGG